MHKTKGPFKIGKMVTQLSETKTSWRPTMEDCSFTDEIILPKMVPNHANICIYGVCDGHGGKTVSDFVSNNMRNIIEDGLSELRTPNEFLNPNLMSKILCNCFAVLEAKLEASQSIDQIRTVGSTCSMVLCSRSLNAFYAINCGDSSVLGICYDRSTQAIKISRITRLHKPNLTDESTRIKNAGGFVTNSSGLSRLCGVLAVSRSFGDYDQRVHGLTEIPEVYGPLKLATSFQSPSETKYLNSNEIGLDTFVGFMIMSDGITDFISEEEIQKLLAENFEKRLIFAHILRESTKSQDNASVISAFIE